MVKEKKKQKKTAKKTLRISPLWALALPALALIVIAAALIVFEPAYLFRVQEYNLFLYTPLFFKQLMVVSGGFLSYLGTYFTQYFYYPWFGVTLLCLWWALLMWLVKKTFNVPVKWSLLLLVPVLCLLITDVYLGYWLFYLKLKGHFFVATIGSSVAVAAVWAYRNVSKKFFLRTLFIIVATLLLYPLFGFYGLLGSALMAVLAFRLPDYNITRKVIDAVVAVLSIALVPLLYYSTVYYQTNLVNIYYTALPLFILDKSYNAFYIPYFLLGLSLALFAFFYKKDRTGSIDKPVLWIAANALVAVVLFGLTYHFWYKDDNFHKELKVNQCAERLDWEGILTIARDTDEPTRMIWMMKNLALFKLGRAGDEMYHFRNGDKQCVAPFMVRMTQTGGKMLYLHYGQLNFCYRWCLEDGVEYGWRVEFYKYMLKCSLLNGEMAVAQKYIDILKQTKYYADWAESYEQYVENPKLLRLNTELGPVMHMMKTEDVLTSDNTLIEIYLLNIFANSDSNDPVLQEQTLLSALQMKDIQMFWPRFFHYARLHEGKPMPKHYQEAAYLYGHLENAIDISQMPFDKDVVDTYNDFMATAQQYAGMTEEQMAPLMYDRFGGTFYYEYFFTRNQKSY